MEKGEEALSRMESQLARSPFVAGDRMTLADIALYANTHLAHEAEFDLTPFPAVRGWIDRVAAEPGHVGMDWRPMPVAA